MMKSKLNYATNRKNMFYNIQFSKNSYREITNLSKLNRCHQLNVYRIN